MKTCPFCNEIKSLNEFSFCQKSLDGHSRRCKKCDQWRHRSFEGKLRSMYRSQFASSKKRKHSPPVFSLEEFKDWAIANGYQKVYSAWVSSDFNRYLAPSADRLDNALSYSLDNIQLVTWGINEQNANIARTAGLIVNHHTAVNQLTKEGVFIRSFVSQAEAARHIGVPQGNLCQVLNGKARRKSVGGYKWEYAS